MAWIKSHPHLLTLILVAVGVLAASGLLVMNAGAFDSNFESVRQNVPKGTKVYQQAQDAIESAQAEFKTPAKWISPGKHSYLFVSERYIINNEQKLVYPTEGSKWDDSFTHEPIPNEWFLSNNLPLFTTGVARQDPDADGFFNEDEWRAKTDPNKKESHPPYHSKLFFVKHIKIPFLLRFQSIDGDPEKDKPETLKFQINTLSLRQPTSFLSVGEMVPGTKFKIDKFEYKKPVTDPNGVEHEASELTLTHTETATPVVLVIGRITDSPDSYALFRYLWPNPAKDIQVKKLQQFVLLPDKEQLYKLLDISEEKALIQTPSGEKVEIPKLPAGYP